ncbi:MAG: Glu/Leu/Phe/Val dehydrogenase dimerization domain-containing protein [Candidatus Hydrothermales bacterium]
MLEEFKNFITKACKEIGFPEGIISLILEPELIEIRNIPYDHEGKVHTFKCIRVVHSTKKPSFLGPIRIKENINLDELKLFSLFTTLQGYLLNIPFSGVSAGIEANEFFIKNNKTRRLLTEKFVSLINDDNTFFFPEEGYEEEDAFLYNFTGKIPEMGGVPQRREILKRGLKIFFDKFSEMENISFKNKRVFIQGAGKISLLFFEIMNEINAKVIGISDSKGAIISNNIEYEKLLLLKKEKGSVKELDGEKITNAELLMGETDILILCGPSDVIKQSNFEKIRAKVIIEVAPSAINHEIYEILSKNKKVLPDIIVGLPIIYINSLEALKRSSLLFLEEEIRYYENNLKNIFSDIYAFSVAKNKSLKLSAHMVSLLKFGRLLFYRGP